MTLFTEIPRSIARLLKSKAFFRTPREINVVALCEKDIISLVTAHMDALGLSVTVQVTGCKPEGQSVPGCVRLGMINVVVSVREMIEVNRSDHQGTGLAAESVIEGVIANLAGQTLQKEDGTTLNVGSVIFDSAQQEEDEDGLYAWSAFFHTSGLIKDTDVTQSTHQEPITTLP